MLLGLFVSFLTLVVNAVPKLLLVLGRFVKSLFEIPPPNALKNIGSIEKRPNNKKTKEGNALSCYTIKSSNVYCPEFDKTIRKLRSDWFIKSSDKKQLLIDIAKSGAKKPYYKTKEASALGCYTNKSSKSYCLKFDKTMHKLRPDWFIKPSDKNKQLLIEMANSGAKRPNNKKTKEGRALSTYTTKSNAYCPIFNKTIRKLRPDWFEKCSPK